MQDQQAAQPSAELDRAPKGTASTASSVEAKAQQQVDQERQHAHEQAGTSGQADLQVRFADVGCGFGGLLVRLSPLYPGKLMIGMEIRDKVCLAFCKNCELIGKS